MFHAVGAQQESQVLRILDSRYHSSSSRDTPEQIYLASRCGKIRDLRRALEAGTNPDGFVDLHGSTALHQACVRGYAACCSLLLDFLAEPDTPDGHGLTPLHAATMCNRPDCISLLLAAGASLEPSVRGGVMDVGGGLQLIEGTALKISRTAGNDECTELIVATGAARQRRQREAHWEAARPRVREATVRALEAALAELEDVLDATDALSGSASEEPGAAALALLQTADECVERGDRVGLTHASDSEFGTLSDRLEADRRRATPLVRSMAEEQLSAAALSGSRRCFERALERFANARLVAARVAEFNEMSARARAARELLEAAVEGEPNRQQSSEDRARQLRAAVSLARKVGLAEKRTKFLPKAEELLERLAQQPIDVARTAAELSGAIAAAERSTTPLSVEKLEIARSRLRAMQVEEKRSAAIDERRAALGLGELCLPTEFVCPITRERMTDPVVASDGHSYEREAIEYLIQASGGLEPASSPVTREALEPRVYANLNLRARIEEVRTGSRIGSH